MTKTKQMLPLLRSIAFTLALFISLFVWVKGFLHDFPSLRPFKQRSKITSYFFPQVLHAAPKKNEIAIDETIRKEIEQEALNILSEELTKSCVDLYDLASKAPFTAKDLDQLNKDTKTTQTAIQEIRKRPVLLQTYENLLFVVIETKVLDPLQITTFEEIVNIMVDHIIRLFPKRSSYVVDLVDAFNDVHLSFIERFIKSRQQQDNENLANTCYMLCYLFDKVYARLNNKIGLDPMSMDSNPFEDETDQNDENSANIFKSNSNTADRNLIQEQQQRLSTWAAPVFARLERRCPEFKSADLEDRLLELAGGSLTKLFGRLAFTLTTTNEGASPTYPLLGPKGLLKHKPKPPTPNTQTGDDDNLDFGFPAGDLANFMSAALRRAVAVEQLPTLEPQLAAFLREQLASTLRPMTGILANIPYDIAAGWLLSPTQRRDVEKVIQTGHESLATLALFLQIRFNYGLQLPSDSLTVMNSKLPVYNFQDQDTKHPNSSPVKFEQEEEEKEYKITYREEFEEDERDWQNTGKTPPAAAQAGGQKGTTTGYTSSTVALVEPLTAIALTSPDRALATLPIEYRSPLVLSLSPMFEELEIKQNTILTETIKATAVLCRGFRKLAFKEIRALNAGEDFRETAFAVTATTVFAQALALPSSGYNPVQDLYEQCIALSVLSEAMGSASIDRSILQALRRAIQIATFYHLNTPLKSRLPAKEFQKRVQDMIQIVELGFETSSIEKVNFNIRKGLESAVSDFLNSAAENEISGTLQSLTTGMEQAWLSTAFSITKKELEMEILRPLGMSRFDTAVAALFLNSEMLLNVDEISDKFFDNLLYLGQECLLESEIFIAQRVLYLLGTILATLIGDAASFTRRLAPSKADFTLKKAALMFRHPVIERVKAVLDAKSVAMEKEKQVIEKEMENAMLELGDDIMLDDNDEGEADSSQRDLEDSGDEEEEDDDDEDQPITKQQQRPTPTKQQSKPKLLPPPPKKQTSSATNNNRLFETAIRLCVISLGGPELLPDALKTIDAAKIRFGTAAAEPSSVVAASWTSSGSSSGSAYETVEQITASFLQELQRALAKEYASSVSSASGRLGGLGQRRREDDDLG